MKNALLKKFFYVVTVLLILIAVIAACSAPTQPAATQAPPAEALPTAESPITDPPTAAPPTTAPTAEPTAAPTLPPTAEAPAVTETASVATQPAATAPADNAATATPPSGLDFLPQEGQWGGGDRELILSFVIGRQNNQATIQNIGLLWFGNTDDCTLDHMLTDITAIDGAEFTRSMVLSNMRYTLTGKIISATEMQGTLDLSYKGCADKIFIWKAIPKIVTP